MFHISCRSESSEYQLGRHFGSEKFWVQKNFVSEKALGKKKICIKKKGSVKAEVLLQWTNVAMTCLAWANVTLTVGICYGFPQEPAFKVWLK